MNESLFWFLMTILSSAGMAFFSTQEMACISYNRLKLEIQARSGSKQAQWIKALLNQPTSLFGTTLVGVNLCLVTCSECIRQLFTSLSLNPNYSVFFLVPYLLLTSELIPMFAARTFPEHTARIGAPIIWALSHLVRPLASFIEKFFRAICAPWKNKDIQTTTPLFHHEELQELLRPFATPKSEEENPAQHIFLTLQRFREKKSTSFMFPIESLPTIYEKLDAESALRRLTLAKKNIALVRTKHKETVGIVTREDLLTIDSHALVDSCMKLIPFLSPETTASHALSRMIEDETLYCFIMNPMGQIIGLLTIDSLLKEGFPRIDHTSRPSSLHISKTIPADTKVADFCQKYDLKLHFNPDDTFSDMVERILEHKPKEGEILFIGPLEVTVKETSLLGAKSLFIQSR